MADKTNGQTGTKQSMTKTEAVRRALAEFGPIAKLSESDSVTHMHGTATLQVGQPEVYSSISTIGRTQDRK